MPFTIGDTIVLDSGIEVVNAYCHVLGEKIHLTQNIDLTYKMSANCRIWASQTYYNNNLSPILNIMVVSDNIPASALGTTDPYVNLENRAIAMYTNTTQL